MRLFSDKHRPVHLGPYPLEKLLRAEPGDTGAAELASQLAVTPEMQQLSFTADQAGEGTAASIVVAMDEYMAMMDAIRIGVVNPSPASCPVDPLERAQHLKSFGYFNDASMVGCCELPASAHLALPFRNPGIDTLSEALKTRQTKTLSSGIDVIMADLRESMEARPGPITDHTHAVVWLYEYPRDPGAGGYANEPGTEWLHDAQAARAALRAMESAVVVAQYLRLFGFEARAHSASTSDVDLNQLTVASGLASVEAGELHTPWLGNRFGVAAVTTNFALAADLPLQSQSQQPAAVLNGLAWKLGKGTRKNAGNREAFSRRRFVDGDHPFERTPRVDTPTTFIDEARVPRVPKRTDMFARALFGDLGTSVQECAKNGHYVRKSAPAMAQRRALGAFILLQDGEAAATIDPSATDAQRNTDNIKATAYFLGCDAVAMSRCPEWVWYSHDATGEAIVPPHDQAVSIIIDQGFETMEGASGDDWISCAQSMRAYLRFSLLGGVIAKQIRRLGYSAKAHTVVDGDVLQPPLLLLSGLGEVSRIGEVILNPYLGPRLKSGVITTTMPLAHDKPIDFGLQTFCEHCNKCARECPSGAITAGPKRMFNGYEIWKSDSQRCTSYRLTNQGGAMCGRCMKTCPWNLEGLFAEAPFRWMAKRWPGSARWLARLDDAVGRGDINPVKKWWWDLERDDSGQYRPTEYVVNVRGLQKSLQLKHEDQTLAVYPAHLAPQPWPFPSPMDREQGIQAHNNLIGAAEYQQRLQEGDLEALAHEYKLQGDAPVLPVTIARANALTDDIALYELESANDEPLPEWQAGAHIDVVVAPEFLRQYSITGDPADRSKYTLAVLREDSGKGGSALMHRIFRPGRRLFVSHPLNHFPLHESAGHSYFMGGGIGVTPMIAMAHRAHAIGLPFALHYSVSTRAAAAFAEQLETVPWRDKVTVHISDEGTRADLAQILAAYQPGDHVYTCGPDAYMNSVMETATNAGFTEEESHLEYFSVPDAPEYTNYAFKLKLKSSSQTIEVTPDQSAADALIAAGIPVDLKCSDGLCGVCQCQYTAGDVEHRDFVLSNAQRKNTLILCQSRAAEEDGLLELDL